MPDIRAVLSSDYKTVVAEVGTHAGALAHIVHEGAEAALCGLPRATLGSYEDLDEPVCASCVAWFTKLSGRSR